MIADITGRRQMNEQRMREAVDEAVWCLAHGEAFVTCRANDYPDGDLVAYRVDRWAPSTWPAFRSEIGDRAAFDRSFFSKVDP